MRQLVTGFGSPLVALAAVRAVSRPNLLIDQASNVPAGIAIFSPSSSNEFQPFIHGITFLPWRFALLAKGPIV
jgi:hypothetical protein